MAMSEAPARAPSQAGIEPARHTLVAAIAVTLMTQVLASAALVAQSVIVPVAAPDLGIQAQSIGVFVSMVYLIAVLAGLVAPAFVRRYGPLRVCQVCVLLLAAGLAIGGIGHVALVPLMVFGTLISVAGSYAAGFAVLAIPPLAVGLRFLFPRA